ALELFRCATVVLLRASLRSTTGARVIRAAGWLSIKPSRKTRSAAIVPDCGGLPPTSRGARRLPCAAGSVPASAPLVQDSDWEFVTSLKRRDLPVTLSQL